MSAPSIDRSSPPRRGGLRAVRPTAPLVRRASGAAASHAPARPWTRRSSAPTASSAVDAQPAHTAGHPSLTARRALSQLIARRLAPCYAQSHKNRLAPALSLEIPRLPPPDSPSWSCTVGDCEDPPSTTPDHLPSPSDRPQERPRQKTQTVDLENFCPVRPFEPWFSPSSWPAPLPHDPVRPARRLSCGPDA